jgi:hypothetical protein
VSLAANVERIERRIGPLDSHEREFVAGFRYCVDMLEARWLLKRTGAVLVKRYRRIRGALHPYLTWGMP